MKPAATIPNVVQGQAAYDPMKTPSGKSWDSTTGNLAGDVNYFQNANASAVKGYGDMVGEDFKAQIGAMLGNLNSIGALRSGGVQAGLDMASAKYGKMIGDYASMTAVESSKQGQEENNAQIERTFRLKQYQDKMKASKKGAAAGIGSVIGGIVGSFVPVIGTAIGAAAGGAIGGAVG
jgi:hypothetical protein